MLGLIQARHVAGDPELTRTARRAVLAEWRADSRRRLRELRDADRPAGAGERRAGLPARTRPQGRARRAARRAGDAGGGGGLGRLGPGSAGSARPTSCSSTSGTPCTRSPARGADRLVLQEQDAVAGTLGLLDAEALMRRLAEAARTIAHAFDATWRTVDRLLSGPARRAGAGRSPTAWSSTAARSCSPAASTRARTRSLVLRAAAAAAEAGLPLAPATVDRAGQPVAADAGALARRGARRAGRPARRRARRRAASGRSSTRRAARPAAARLGARTAPPAAQPGAPFHRRPAPDRGRRRTPPPTPATCPAPTCC